MGYDEAGKVNARRELYVSTSIDSFGPHNGANVNRTQSQQKRVYAVND